MLLLIAAAAFAIQRRHAAIHYARTLMRHDDFRDYFAIRAAINAVVADAIFMPPPAAMMLPPYVITSRRCSIRLRDIAAVYATFIRFFTPYYDVLRRYAMPYLLIAAAA